MNKYKLLKNSIEAGKNILLNVSPNTASLTERYPEVLDLLDFVVVLPEKGAKMKKEIFKRCENRTDHDEWFTNTYLPQNYDAMWKLANEMPFPKIYLKPGQYLTDILNKDGSLKPGVELE
jgi:hypothetical protein